jgi:hypothetical protein
MADSYPIRLPSGGKAILIVPEEFSQGDADHVKQWVDLIAQTSEPPKEPTP